MARVVYICHPDVVVDPQVPVPRWPLNDRGRAVMQDLVHQLPFETLGAVFSSNEQKAIDGAQILAAHYGAPHLQRADLGENDRSARRQLSRLGNRPPCP